MSIQVSQFVWQRSKQKQTALVVMLALADFADKVTGECFPGVPTLAQMARTSIRNVQFTLKKLEQDGEITITERPGRSNLYLINGYREWVSEGVKSSAQRDEVQRQEVVNPEAGGVKSSTEGVNPVSHEPLLEPIREPEMQLAVIPGGISLDQKHKDVWAAALDQLQAQLDRKNFDTWLRGVTLLRVECGAPSQSNRPDKSEYLKRFYGGREEVPIFVLGVRNGFVRDALEQQFDRMIRRILSDAMGDRADFRTEVSGRSSAIPPGQPAMRMPTLMYAVGK